MKKPLLLLLLLSLLMFGCIKESAFNLQKESRLLYGEGFDFDKDGKQEMTLYKFTPLTAVEGGQRINFIRYLYLRPSKITVEATTGNESDSLFEERMRRVLKEATLVYSQCRSKLPACSSPGSCAASCYSQSCKLYRSDDIGIILKDFSDVLRELNKEKGGLEASLLRARTSGNRTEAYEKAVGVYEMLKAVQYHPAVKVLGLCKATFDEGAFSFLDGRVEVKRMSGLDFVAVEPEGLKDVAEVRMEVQLSPILTPDIKALTVPTEGEVVSSDPIRIRYTARKFSGNAKDVLAYAVEGTFENAGELARRWARWDIEIRFIALQIPYLDEVKKVMYSIYSFSYQNTNMPYVSIGLGLSLIVVAVVVLVEVAGFAYSFLTNALNRPVGESVLIALGGGDRQWWKKILLGLIFLSISAGLDLYFTQRTTLKAFESYELRRIFEEDNIGFLSALGTAISAYLFTTGMVGALREALAKPLRKKYRTSVSMEKVEELYAKIKSLLDEKSELGINIEEEYNRWLSISLKALKELKGREQERALAEAYQTLEGIRSSLEKKERIALENYPEWEAYIKEMLSRQDVLSINSLIAIPPQWRLWAVHKYINSHPEELVVLEGQNLVKKHLPLEERIRRQITAKANQGLLALYIEKPGEKYWIYKESPHREFAKVMAFQIHQKMLLKNISELRLSGSVELFAKRFGNIFLLMLTKDKESLDKALEGLQSLPLEG